MESGHEAPWGLYGAVDIGSHTVRMVVAEWRDDGRVCPVHHERHVTRLAQGFGEKGMLTQEAMERTEAVLSGIASRLRDFEPRVVRCGATGVVRRAANGPDFLRRVQDMASWKASILSEAQEAALSLRGMLSVLEPPEDFVVCFDLGGSSTELALVDRRNPSPLWIGSVFVGAATLTEAYLQEAPTSFEQLSRAARHARGVLKPAVENICEELRRYAGSAKGVTVAGTAGTVTTLAAMESRMERYIPYCINNRSLTKAWIAETLRSLAGMGLEERGGIVGLESGREDIIVGGTVIVEEILNSFGVSSLLVSDAGLLEGLLWDGMQSCTAPYDVPWQWSAQSASGCKTAITRSVNAQNREKDYG
ncbi:Ppx/GppA phosphatase family protein [Desulfosoma sp.]|uniref:Ppx/GppA phosphatase family protein n=1 Tax=Desulfosoma sp. TaxID=2603217 RepID=UPI004049CE8C